MAPAVAICSNSTSPFILKPPCHSTCNCWQRERKGAETPHSLSPSRAEWSLVDRDIRSQKKLRMFLLRRLKMNDRMNVCWFWIQFQERYRSKRWATRDTGPCTHPIIEHHLRYYRDNSFAVNRTHHLHISYTEACYINWQSYWLQSFFQNFTQERYVYKQWHRCTW